MSYAVMDNAFVKSARDVLAYFGADERVGQTEEQVKKAREKYGANGETADRVVRTCR